MSTSAASVERPRSAWIISPTWDMTWLVATPIAIVPIVWIVSRRLATPEQVDLVVASFASLGHHLPGFMRCYGDRELFQRFRWRFLLAPPAFLAISYLFVANGLHGLMLVLLLWGTWHGLMQTYGLMRIYDLKRGDNDPLTARLDFWLCVMMFSIGMVFSDARVYGVMGALWQSGIPTFSSLWLQWTRIAVAAATVLVTVAYGLNLRRKVRSSQGVSRTKLLLAMSTGGLYWISGAATTNLLIGIAMFEIFHAVQYYAIVWTYNRRLAERAGARFGPLGFLFQDRWVFVGVYLAAILSFGCIRFFGGAVENPALQTALLVTISTSTLLHFYYDGFIWKVREKKTQVNLDIAVDGAVEGSLIPAFVHAGRFGMLVLLMGGLFAVERTNARASNARQQELLAALATWTPDLPELQAQLSRQALQAGDTAKAIEVARQAVRLRPRWHAAHADLGTALLAAGDFQAAIEPLRRAVELRPGEWQSHHNLARAWEGVGKVNQAIVAMRTAAQLQAGSQQLWTDLGRMQARAGKLADSIASHTRATELDPQSATAVYELAVVQLQAGNVEAARQSIARTLELQPDHALGHFQRGNLAVAAGDLAEAESAYRRAIALAPELPEAYNNLGAVLFQRQDIQAAVKIYRRSLELQPDNADATYNLGLAYLQLGRLEDARARIVRAEQLGRSPSPEVAAYLGM